MIEVENTDAHGCFNDIRSEEEGSPPTETCGGGNGFKGISRGAPADDEPVGYGRPPKHSQFKPGQSGNPKGRPRNARGLKTLLRKEMNERVRVTENGKTKTLSKLEVILKRLTERAAKGDAKATAKLIEMNMVMFGIEDEEHKVTPLTPEEEEILRNLQAKRFSSDAESGHQAVEGAREDKEEGEREDGEAIGGGTDV